jgi:hypothetical protein
MDTSPYQKDISAINAKFEAQKIAFAPLAFQAVRALRDLNILRLLSDAGDRGLSREEAAKTAGISPYGAGVLLEMALGLGVVKLAAGPVAGPARDGPSESAAGPVVEPVGGPGESAAKPAEPAPGEPAVEPAPDGPGESAAGPVAKLAGGPGESAAPGGPADRERFVLGKTGWFLLEDEMTGVNFDFVNDICYKGAFELIESIKTGGPQGLETFGSWPTIYDALAFLPERAKKSWFEFDHFYSGIAFSGALPVVFADPRPRRLLDIGGNTAKWAVQCCTYDNAVQVTVADLPGQTAMAEKNAAAAGFADRISVYPCNVLDPVSALPSGYDAVWMSQFLDCFALEDVTAICKKAAAACTPQTRVYVLEPLWDKQRFEAAAFSLQATSLYFTCMANGRSKMYRYDELRQAVEAGGFSLAEERHDLGSNCYSLLCFRPTA